MTATQSTPTGQTAVSPAPVAAKTDSPVRRFYANSRGYSLAYFRPKEFGKEGEREQRLMQFNEFPSGTLRHVVGSAVLETHYFSVYETRDQYEITALEARVGAGGGPIMTEEQFNLKFNALRIRMDDNEAQAFVSEHNSLMERLKHAESRLAEMEGAGAVESKGGGKGGK